MQDFSDETWEIIRKGNDRFPSLFNFKNTTEHVKRSTMQAVTKASRSSLRKAYGPRAYEEAHRVFSNFYHHVKTIEGMRPAFFRAKSDKDVELIREWTLELVSCRIEPVEYLQIFWDSYKRSKTFGYEAAKSPQYVFAVKTIDGICGNILAARKQEVRGSSINSYQGKIPLNVHNVLKSMEGFDFDEWTEAGLIQIFTAAKSLRDGSGTFMSNKLRKPAEYVAKELYGWTDEI